MKKIDKVRLHEIVKGAIMDFVNESGKTKRGRYMMGRLLKRAEDSGKDDLADELRGRVDMNDDPVRFGYMNQKHGHGPNVIKANYNSYKKSDMDDLVSQFRKFSEDKRYRYDTYVLKVPLEDVIKDFEREVLGFECTPDMIRAIYDSMTVSDDYDDTDYDEVEMDSWYQ